MKIKSFVLAAVLVTAVLCFGVAKAQTTDTATLIAQLQAQIQSLMQQIQQLIAQQGGQTWCHTFNTNLGVGSGGDEVSALNSALSREGLSVSLSGSRTASFDEDVAANVVAFQQKYGYSVS